MTSNLPRYRQRPTGGMHPLVKAGVLVLLPLLAVAGLVMAITDGAPTLTARAEGGSPLPDFSTPGTSSTSGPAQTPSDTPTEPGETASPEDSATPSPEESGDGSSDGSGSGSGADGSGSGSSDDDELAATSPPREPDSRPTTPGEPTDEPDPEPTDEPDPSPSDDPSEPSEPEPTEEPDPEPTEDPEPDFPDLPIIDLSNAEAQMVESVDEARAEAGCPALRVDPRLTIASREHSEDMRDRDYVAHVNPDGEGPDERAADEGYTGRVAENLSEGIRSPGQVVRDWEAGGDERDRLLDCRYTSIGVGTERGGLLGLSSWWTLMLGTD